MIQGADPNTIFVSTIGGHNRWGMKHPDWTFNQNETFETMQGVNYRNANPIDYMDAWHVNRCLVSDKTMNGYNV